MILVDVQIKRSKQIAASRFPIIASVTDGILFKHAKTKMFSCSVYSAVAMEAMHLCPSS